MCVSARSAAGEGAPGASASQTKGFTARHEYTAMPFRCLTGQLQMALALLAGAATTKAVHLVHGVRGLSCRRRTLLESVPTKHSVLTCSVDEFA